MKQLVIVTAVLLCGMLPVHAGVLQPLDGGTGVTIDSGNIKLLLLCKKVVLYHIGNQAVAPAQQDQHKKYADGYEILEQYRVAPHDKLTAKMLLLDPVNYTNAVSKCSFVPAWCLSFIYKGQRLNYYFSGSDDCESGVVLQISGADRRETYLNVSSSLISRLSALAKE